MANTLKEVVPLERLLEIIRALRDKETGCPWDLEQTIETYPKNILNEAEEIQNAIENGNSENLKEELGDTLFNLLFMIHMAEEKDLFRLNDVIESSRRKMIRRHPHVFGDKKAASPEEALRYFYHEKEKEKEKDKKENRS